MNKSSLLVAIIITLMICASGGIGYAYGVSQRETANMEFARDTGYKQGCVESYHELGMISDSDYNSYLEASDKYDNEPSKKNLENLSELVNRLLSDLAM